MTVCNEKYKELIALYSTGALTSEEKDAVVNHIKECDACKEELEIYQAIEEELDLSMYQAPKDLHKDVMKRLPHKNKTRVVRYQPYMSVAAALVFVVLLGLVGLMNPNLQKTASDDAMVVNETMSQNTESFEAESSMSVAQDAPQDAAVQENAIVEEAMEEDAGAEGKAAGDTGTKDADMDRAATTQALDSVQGQEKSEDTPQESPRIASESIKTENTEEKAAQLEAQTPNTYRGEIIIALVVLFGISCVIIYRRAKKR